MSASPQDVLRRLAVADETYAHTILSLAPDPARSGAAPLAPRLRTLVRLAALIAVDAPTSCLYWAAEQAACCGAGVDEIVGVLVTVAPEVGLPRVVSAAPRLALAIGCEPDVEPDD
jgi:alkylhydroperoxidase/carboxymuconolactone decarboxylase family protein YurZ